MKNASIFNSCQVVFILALLGMLRMIGIKLELYSSPIITEFFELFKTPWEFFNPEQVYEVIITDKLQNGLDAKLIIIFHQEKNPYQKVGRNKLHDQPVLICYDEIIFPIYMGVRELINKGPPLINELQEGRCIGSYCYEEGKVVLHIGYNFFEEAGYLITTGQPPEYACFPTLDIHIANLRKWILRAGVQLVEIPPRAIGSSFFVCLTHDVDFAGIRNHKFDHTLAGFFYRALVTSLVKYIKGEHSLNILVQNWVAVAKLPFIQLGLIKDYWATFEQYRAIEQEAPSTFFFVPFKNRAGKGIKGISPFIRAVKYEVEKLKPTIVQLLEADCEIGVHGIDSWIDCKNGREEISKIRTLTGHPELGVRMHWLYFDLDSPKKLEQAGYAFDSTCGFNEVIGYKSGTSQVYKPLAVKHLMELPMHIMDTALFYPDRMNLTFSEGINAIKVLMQTVVDNGGVLTINWHDRSIGPERFWNEVYCHILNELKVQEGLFLTAGAAVNWFRKRRTVRFQWDQNNNLSKRIKLTGFDIKPVDKMFLRIYVPVGQEFNGNFHKSTTVPYQDILLDGQNEIEIFPENT